MSSEENFYVVILDLVKMLTNWQLFFIILFFLILRFLGRLAPNQIEEIFEALKECCLSSIIQSSKRKPNTPSLDTTNTTHPQDPEPPKVTLSKEETDTQE